ncbi:MAG: ceramide glucosyltransferase [Myxococcaceae bacterium]
MMTTAAFALFALAATGLGALLLQFVVALTRPRVAPPEPRLLPRVSVLKPLCGVEDGLLGNLQAFCRLDYPSYEVLLGVKDELDAAYPLARSIEAEHPGRVRVILQGRAPGLNPKVNQLIGLAAAARFDILVVSDSNVRAAPGYLREIAAHLADLSVGCVTHPVAGAGHRTLGSLLDNLHLSSSIGPGMLAAKRLAGKDLVVGKSMAMRAADLRRLGGFEAFKDVLAEDYVFGTQVTRVLRKKVALATSGVVNVSQRRSVGDFFGRYLRWSVIHRTAVQPSTYLAQALLNPTPIAAVAFALKPAGDSLTALVACLVLKAFLDVLTARTVSPGQFGFAAFLAVPLKDLLLFAAWANGLVSRTVVWRGTRLRVMPGSLLVPAGEGARGSPAEQLTLAEETGLVRTDVTPRPPPRPPRVMVRSRRTR